MPKYKMNKKTMIQLHATKQSQAHVEKINGSQNVTYHLYAGDQPTTVGYLGYNAESNSWGAYCGGRYDIDFRYLDIPRFATRDEALVDFKEKYMTQVNLHTDIEKDLLAIEPSEFTGEPMDIAVQVMFTDKEYYDGIHMEFRLPLGIVFAILEGKDPRFGLFGFDWQVGIKWEIHKHTDAYSLYRGSERLAVSHTKGQWHH